MHSETFHLRTDLLVHFPVSSIRPLISLGGDLSSFSTDLRYWMAASTTSERVSMPLDPSSLPKDDPLSGKPLILIASMVLSRASCLAILTLERDEDQVSWGVTLSHLSLASLV